MTDVHTHLKCHFTFIPDVNKAIVISFDHFCFIRHAPLSFKVNQLYNTVLGYNKLCFSSTVKAITFCTVLIRNFDLITSCVALQKTLPFDCVAVCKCKSLQGCAAD